jgi:ATP-dependent helicase STH1/SNF2
MKSALTLETAADRAAYRRLKKQSMKEARITEKLEQKHRLERERRERLKYQEHLQAIVQHGRDLVAFNAKAQTKVANLGRLVVKWHQATEKEEQKKQERLSKERLKALKVKLRSENEEEIRFFFEERIRC